MPKSRYGKGKRYHGKQVRRQPSPQVASPEAVAVASKPMSPRPSIKTSTPSRPSPAYQYIGTELRRIGILAGIILVILIVLAYVL